MLASISSKAVAAAVTDRALSIRGCGSAGVLRVVHTMDLEADQDRPQAFRLLRGFVRVSFSGLCAKPLHLLNPELSIGFGVGFRV